MKVLPGRGMKLNWKLPLTTSTGRIGLPGVWPGMIKPMTTAWAEDTAAAVAASAIAPRINKVWSEF